MPLSPGSTVWYRPMYSDRDSMRNRSGAALATHYRLGSIPTYGFSGLTQGEEVKNTPRDTTLLQTLNSPDNDTEKFTTPSTTHQMQLTLASQHDTECKPLHDKPHTPSLLQKIPYPTMHDQKTFRRSSDTTNASPWLADFLADRQRPS